MISQKFKVATVVSFLTICIFWNTTLAVKFSQQDESLILSNPRTLVKRSSSNINGRSKPKDTMCGQENKYEEGVTAWSRFPWTVAILKRNKDGLRFFCGATLISTKTVISVAHCFSTQDTIKPEDIVVSINWHNVNNWSDALNVDVEKVILHPDYRDGDADADLAVLHLKESLTLTDSVRPICLWKGSTDFELIEDKSGTFVSWGADSFRNTKTAPIFVNATIVSHLNCLKSNTLFSSLLTNRTFCAGNRDGTGPCLGDSGNALTIKRGGKWLLRGILSNAPQTASSIETKCYVDAYVVYTDTALFSKWIKSNMLL